MELDYEHVVSTLIRAQMQQPSNVIQQSPSPFLECALVGSGGSDPRRQELRPGEMQGRDFQSLARDGDVRTEGSRVAVEREKRDAYSVVAGSIA
jgi:hypothetical protein